MTGDEEKSEIEEYAELFPKIVRLSVNGLASEDEHTFAVVAAIVENGGSLQPDELADELGTDVETVHDMTDDLQRGGIVVKKAGKEIGNQDVGAYEMSTYGNRILDGLYEASTPRNNESES
jgi:hypothetical protein